MERTDEALMAAYVAGDGDALRLLYERYRGLLTRLLARGMPRSFDPGDLVQHTFLQLHRARFDFKPSARLRPWLITIAMNLKRDHLRRNKRSREVILDELPERSVPATASDTLLRQEAATQLHQALTKLPDNPREVITLHWLEGLSFAEVAEIVGASRSAVKVRAHRGYKKLREHLEKIP